MAVTLADFKDRYITAAPDSAITQSLALGLELVERYLPQDKDYTLSGTWRQISLEPPAASVTSPTDATLHYAGRAISGGPWVDPRVMYRTTISDETQDYAQGLLAAALATRSGYKVSVVGGNVLESRNPQAVLAELTSLFCR